MKLFRTLLLAGITLCSAIARNEANSQSSGSPAAAAQRAAVFSPGLDDLMTLLVQPRHIKLNSAGLEGNWELAAFELGELRSAFRRIAQAVPVYQGGGVQDAVQVLMVQQMDNLEAAIAAADASEFTRSFAQLTAGCNACHAYMEHPFLVIRVPPRRTSPAFIDQDFGSSRQR